MAKTAISLLSPSASRRSRKSSSVVLEGRAESDGGLAGMNLVGVGAQSTDPAFVSTRVQKSATKVVDDGWRRMNGASTDEVAGLESRLNGAVETKSEEFLKTEEEAVVDAEVEIDEKPLPPRLDGTMTVPTENGHSERKDTKQMEGKNVGDNVAFESWDESQQSSGALALLNGVGRRSGSPGCAVAAKTNNEEHKLDFSLSVKSLEDDKNGTVVYSNGEAVAFSSREREASGTLVICEDLPTRARSRWGCNYSVGMSPLLLSIVAIGREDTTQMQVSPISIRGTHLTTEALLSTMKAMLVDMIRIAVRTTVPFAFDPRLRHYLRKGERRLQESVVSHAETSIGLNLSAQAKQTTTSKQGGQRTSQRQAEAADGVVVGLRNYGQTCFLNSVLQSLASLPPFVAYLERIVELHRDRRLVLGSNTDESDNGDDELTTASRSLWSGGISAVIWSALSGHSSPRRRQQQRPKVQSGNVSAEPELLSEVLLATLKGVNGASTLSDPRALLQHVGSRNSQFRSRHGGLSRIGTEQQDAHELLQALMSLVIVDSELDFEPTKTRGSVSTTENEERRMRVLTPSSLRTSLSSASLMDLSVTDAEAAVAATGDSSGATMSPKGMDYSEVKDTENGSLAGSDGSEALSLSSFLYRMDQESHRLRKQRVRESTSHDKGHVASQDPSPLGCWKEEKKQEAEELALSLNDDQEVQDVGNGSVANGYSGHFSSPQTTLPGGKYEPSQKGTEGEVMQSPTTQAMLRAQSPISPSPLTGWVGSTLQCCTCGHTRPIQNAPFLEIPIVPTSISDTYGGRYSSCQHASQVLPACSLKQCLQNFTAVERVQDVECRSCTIRAELRGVEDEAEVVVLAMETLRRRNAGRSGNDLDGLQRELAVLESRREKLLRQDLDGEESDITAEQGFAEDSLAPDDSSRLLYDDIARSDKALEGGLQRGDAKKCLLLTRLPSILCLHVQRRYLDPKSNLMTKAMQHVDFPVLMDFSPYSAYGGGVDGETHSKPSCVGKGASSTTLTPPSPMMYRLMSVIEHKGNAFGGHYQTYRRRQTSSSSLAASQKKEWALVSDESVSYVTWNEVRKCQAYMLFYEAIA